MRYENTHLRTHHNILHKLNICIIKLCNLHNYNFKTFHLSIFKLSQIYANSLPILDLQNNPCPTPNPITPMIDPRCSGRLAHIKSPYQYEIQKRPTIQGYAMYYLDTKPHFTYNIRQVFCRQRAVIRFLGASRPSSRQRPLRQRTQPKIGEFERVSD